MLFWRQALLFGHFNHSTLKNTAVFFCYISKLHQEDIILKCVQKAFTCLELVNDSSSVTRDEDWCHPWPDHHPTTGAAFSLSSPHTHLSAACFPSTCGMNLHRWSLSFILQPSLSSSFTPTPLFCLSVSFMSYVMSLFMPEKGSADCKYGEVSGPEGTGHIFLDPSCEVYRSIFLSWKANMEWDGRAQLLV